LTGDLSAQTGSISDALRNIPSVEVDVQGNVSMRGDSSVTVLIDGKPSSLFQGDSRGQALQQLPANRFERVEVISNPSAEFRADGSGGVINLISKKAKGIGSTSSLRLTTGDSGRGGASASWGHNSSKLSATSDINYRRDPATQLDFEHLRQPSLTSLTEGDTKYDFESLSGSSALTYDATDRLRLGGDVRLSRFDFAIDSFANTSLTDTTGAQISAFDRDLTVRQRRDNAALGANLLRRFTGDGHEFALKISYDVTNDDRVRTGHTTILLPTSSNVFDRQLITNDIRQTGIKGDYVRPMPLNRTLKIGFDLQFDDNAYDNDGLQGVSAGSLTTDPSLTSRFLYERALSQAYTTYERSFGRLTALGGIRYEEANIDLVEATSNQRYQNNDSRFLPSLHLAWTLNDQQKLTASFSERIQRPAPQDLNPFRFRLDPLNFRAGNPNLRPQETQSFELGWQYRRAPLMAMATLYYRDNSKVMTDLVSDLGGGVLLSSRVNASKTRNGGLELILAGRLTAKLSYNLSGNLFWSELDSANLGFAGKRSVTSGQGRAGITWQPSPTDTLQINATRSAKRLTPQGYSLPATGIDLGYRRKIDDRTSLVITIQDVLGTYRDKYVLNTTALSGLSVRDVDARLARVGLVWSFGGGKARKEPGFDFQGPAIPPQ